MENPTINTSNTASTSPEFEFRNPSSDQTVLHSADQLFSGGILLPLRLLNVDDPPGTPTEPINTPSITPVTDDINGSDPKTSSKRWKDIFKKNPSESKDSEKKNKKKTKERNSGGVGAATAELNINLWPFSRSRSAGNNVSRTRTAAGNRKVSSAPCSRSNSTGDKHRKWPASPGRTGVHLGRSSPVWQAKRFGQSRSLHDGAHRPGKNSTTGAGANGKVSSLNVPTCIGYRQRMSCQSDVGRENRAGGNAGVTPVSAAGEGGATGLFNLRSLFTKKVF